MKIGPVARDDVLVSVGALDPQPIGAVSFEDPNGFSTPGMHAQRDFGAMTLYGSG